MIPIQVNSLDLEIICGDFDKALSGNSRLIFDESVCDFLGSLSESILGDEESRQHGDVVAFAYKKNCGAV